ncbi:MAG: DUF2085 domain-containing protein [Phototrophicaceae bacterium]
MTSSAPPRKRGFALRLNLALYWMAKRWLTLTLVILGIYVTLPFVAPTLMHFGYTRPAMTLYWLYKPFCHQFGFRSFFLYGEQAVYPRATTGTTLVSFEEMIERTQPEAFQNVSNLYAQSSQNPAELRAWLDFQWASWGFVGNEAMGYKMTICARDIAIYLALWLGGVLYALVRKRLRPVPLWLWFLLGIGPIGIDGFSQLLSYPPFELWPVRETLPFFRVLTGASFGFMNAWLGYPYLEMTFNDTVRELRSKFRRAGIAVS